MMEQRMLRPAAPSTSCACPLVGGPCASASASSPRPAEEDTRRDLLPGCHATHLEARALGGGDAVGTRVRVPVLGAHDR